MKFKLKEIVKTTDGTRKGGIVKYLTCKAATSAGGKTCDKKTCNHPLKDRVWVVWADSKSFSYEEKDLEADAESLKKIEQYISKKDEEKKQEVKKEFDRIETKVDWTIYNGFNKVKVDRYGRRYIEASAMTENTAPPIKETEINWDAYNGFEKGSYRKQALKDNPANV